jgi:hypothetical protein
VSTYLGVPQGAENDLAATVAACLIAHGRRTPLIVSVADLLATIPRPTHVHDPVRTWTAILLDAGLPAEDLIVYRQAQITDLAANAVLLSRWIDTTDALERPGPHGLSHVVNSVVALADLLASAPDDATACLDGADAVRQRFVELTGNGAPLPSSTRTWEDRRLRDVPALQSLTGLPLDRGRDQLPSRIRKIDSGTNGELLGPLHALAEKLAGAQAPCPHHGGNRSTKDCVTARLIGFCDRLTHLACTAHDPTVCGPAVEQVAERSRAWANERATRLHDRLHATLFALPALARRTP